MSDTTDFGTTLAVRPIETGVDSTVDALLFTDINQMKVLDKLAVFSACKKVGAALDKRAKEIHPHLMDLAATEGELDPLTGSSTFEADFDGETATVTRQARTSVSINSVRLMEVCANKGLSLESVGDHVFTPSNDKIAAMVAAGKLTEEDVAYFGMSQTTFALVVKPTPTIDNLLPTPKKAKAIKAAK